MCCEFASLTVRVRIIKPRGVVLRRFGLASIWPSFGRYLFGFRRLRACVTSSSFNASSRCSERNTVERLRLMSHASLCMDGHASRVFALKYVDNAMATARSAPQRQICPRVPLHSLHVRRLLAVTLLPYFLRLGLPRGASFMWCPHCSSPCLLPWRVARW